MGILPKIINENNNNLEQSITQYKSIDDRAICFKKSYIVDFKNKELLYFNGRPLIETDLRATKMFIEKLILTNLGEWFGHKKYGTVYKELTYHKKYNSDITESLIKENLREQLLSYYDIIVVNNIEIVQKLTTLYISFDVITKNKDFIHWEGDIKNGIR